MRDAYGSDQPKNTKDTLAFAQLAATDQRSRDERAWRRKHLAPRMPTRTMGSLLCRPTSSAYINMDPTTLKSSALWEEMLTV